MKYQNEEIDIIAFDECGITSIEWVGENEIDLELKIDLCSQNLGFEIDFNNISTKFLFTFCHDIDFCFKHKLHSTIGALEISKFNYSKSNDGIYCIEFLFDFQPVGHIKFNCTGFELRIIEN